MKKFAAEYCANRNVTSSCDISYLITHIRNNFSRWEIQKGSDWHRISTPDCVGVVRETSSSNQVYKQLILENGIDTVDKIWEQAARQYGSKLCLGTRTVLGEEQVTQPDGKETNVYIDDPDWGKPFFVPR